MVSKRVVLGWNVGSKERSEEEKLNAGFNACRTRLGGKGALHSDWVGGTFVRTRG